MWSSPIERLVVKVRSFINQKNLTVKEARTWGRCPFDGPFFFFVQKFSSK